MQIALGKLLWTPRAGFRSIPLETWPFLRTTTALGAMNSSKFKKFCTLFLLLTFVTSLASGCVRRRMTVRSNPPGATVYLDGKEIGRTPFSTNFDFYGKREFRVVKQGYETKTTILPVRAPWYQWIGFDFVSEVLLPGKLTDRHYYEFDLQPEQVIPKYELVGRAEDLRRMAHADGVVQVNPAITGTYAPDSAQPAMPPAGSIAPPY